MYLLNGATNERLFKTYSATTFGRKEKNLAKQAELKEQSSLLDYAITAHPEVHGQVNRLSNSGGSTRVQLNGIIPKDLRVQYKVTRSWDQNFYHR